MGAEGWGLGYALDFPANIDQELSGSEGWGDARGFRVYGEYLRETAPIPMPPRKLPPRDITPPLPYVPLSVVNSEPVPPLKPTLCPLSPPGPPEPPPVHPFNLPISLQTYPMSPVAYHY